MIRWYRRFCELSAGRQHTVDSEYYIDDIYAFFQNCYHLKDWLKNDNTIDAKIRSSVEDLIDLTRPLRLCADLCNSLKHLHLRTDRSGESPAFAKKRYALNLGSQDPKISLHYDVKTSRGIEDAFALATDCIEAWDTFLHENGLSLGSEEGLGS